MRLFIFTLLLALIIGTVLAIASQKAVLVSYPDETPQKVLDKAMGIIKEAGGVITHEYTFFKGFAAKASATALESIKTLGEEYIPLIEDDIVVHVDGSLNTNPQNA